ncbi:rhombosortase [Ideonella sp. A 288]|uniref:rhombosortase n=1 Tax=Ideonella sp. A 288 TaxID=1962181 RepID=UPI000B4AED80|nr:rhombosortase [Ideonella sp. A 288]
MNRARIWPGLCGCLAVGAAMAVGQDADAWNWQPALALQEPWRLWTAALVHLSPLHLGVHLIGVALLAALGVAAGCGPRASLAWALAWPLTHLGLLWQPALQHYGGLSGVLHAGVAVVAVHLWVQGTGRRRRIGLVVALGLVTKVLLEAPWSGAPRQSVGWDITMAPLAHATGAVAGLLCAALLCARRRPAGRSATVPQRWPARGRIGPDGAAQTGHPPTRQPAMLRAMRRLLR